MQVNLLCPLQAHRSVTSLLSDNKMRGPNAEKSEEPKHIKRPQQDERGGLMDTVRLGAGPASTHSTSCEIAGKALGAGCSQSAVASQGHLGVRGIQ